MLPFHAILTDRLELRRFSRNDLSAFQEYRRDPELSKYQGWEPTADEDALAFLIEQSDQILGPDGQWLQIAVTCIKSKRLIGDFGLCVRDSRRGIAEMGFTISRTIQRQGYATEAAAAILVALFGTNMIYLVTATTDERNRASISLLLRLGFELAKTQTAVFRGELCTEHTFEVSATQWYQLR